MPTMQLKIMQMGRIAFFFFYVIYALAPIHMYAMTGCSDEARDRIRAGKHRSTDIVWVNILFASLVDDVEASTPDPRISADAKQGGEVVLVKKRRVLFREQFDIKPLFNVEMLPPGGLERPLLLSANYETAKDPLLRETDGCLSLNTGLSPPAFLS